MLLETDMKINPRPEKKRDFSFTPAAFDIPALAHYLGITNNRAEELTRDGVADNGEKLYRKFPMALRASGKSEIEQTPMNGTGGKLKWNISNGT
jgi:hypothetical protein